MKKTILSSLLILGLILTGCQSKTETETTMENKDETVVETGTTQETSIEANNETEIETGTTQEESTTNTETKDTEEPIKNELTSKIELLIQKYKAENNIKDSKNLNEKDIELIENIIKQIENK